MLYRSSAFTLEALRRGSLHKSMDVVPLGSQLRRRALCHQVRTTPTCAETQRETQPCDATCNALC